MTKRSFKMRVEQDTLGTIEVPEEAYYGAQTARSLSYFNIGRESIPEEVIYYLAVLKRAAAKVNVELNVLPADIGHWIERAATEVIEGKFKDQFPLKIWQTGSGTQTNMNVNEVIANRATELAGGTKGSHLIHPNDDVNKSQSSNDLFPTAMYMAACEGIVFKLIPAITELKEQISKKSREFSHIVKVGRTHLMDAVPLTLGQEFSGYVSQLESDLQRLHLVLDGLYELPIGATAVGTGLNAPVSFGKKMIEEVKKVSPLPFRLASNNFASLAAHDALVFASGALKTLACSLMKIANDIRWMGSGPCCGLSELVLPANEPGSSIMPGKVNPTQCEAMAMVCIQVMGNDLSSTIAGSKGDFELNVCKPLLIYNFLQSLCLLRDATLAFSKFLIEGLQANIQKIEEDLSHSLMLATVLTPKIGYEKSARVVQEAFKRKISLKEACLKLGYLSSEEFDEIVQPIKMTRA